MFVTFVTGGLQVDGTTDNQQREGAGLSAGGDDHCRMAVTDWDLLVILLGGNNLVVH